MIEEYSVSGDSGMSDSGSCGSKYERPDDGKDFSAKYDESLKTARYTRYLEMRAKEKKS